MKTVTPKITPHIKYLFFITAVVLIVFGAGSFMRINNDPNMKMMYNLYAVLMFGDALAMLVCGLSISKQKKLIYWFAVSVLGLNIILTIFDQFGLVDLLFSLLNVITLAALIFNRREFLSQ